MDGKITYYQRKRAKKYYKNNKVKLREKAKYKYRELSNEEIETKREYERNRYHNVSEENTQRLKENQKYIVKQKKKKKN